MRGTASPLGSLCPLNRAPIVWRTHNADEIMAEIVSKRLVEHLERAGFVVMKRCPAAGAATLARGAEEVG